LKDTILIGYELGHLILSETIMTVAINLLASPGWTTYELLDSGDGQKLERFGSYTFVRPEVQALWTKTLPADRWQEAHAVFQPSGEESGGHWVFKRKIPEQWEMSYAINLIPGPSQLKKEELKFSVMTTPGRHLGVFPECATHWDWMGDFILKAGQSNSGNPGKSSSQQAQPLSVLNLFGYTGLASLSCALAGAKVTHVDASKKSVGWARANQLLSGLTDKPIRWIVDDALKFVEREARRGAKYDGILLDPPKFGRGPKGEVWEVYKSLPGLLQSCRAILSDQPSFIILTVYAVKLPAIHVHTMLAEMMKGRGGDLECGELVTEEKSAGRLLSQAVYARWSSPRI
jgi:23S rRNA (cytosine1962-C5)-methyltransferase